MESAQFRPHHIFCERFLKVQLPERGAKYKRVEQKLRNIVETHDDALVELIEGIDELCQACPECRHDRCESPLGNEDSVRKWDGIILKGLGISYGETKTSREWHTLIEEKAPLEFCETKCPWKSICTVFELG